MGKISEFDVVLNSPQAVYFPGQLIQGQVILNLNEEMKMKGIYLELIGAANVHWTETRSYTEGVGSQSHTRTETIHFYGHENYFTNKVILFGNAGGMFADSTKHPRGYFTFPFTFQLPPQLPSSFEGTYGSVRYFTRCSINRPWKFDHKTKQPFTVISNLDLNTIPDAMSVPQGQKSKTLCCLCCASGAIEAIVRINRKGHVPGEAIAIDAEVTNGSNRRINYTKVQLVQKTVYRASGATNCSMDIVAEKRHGRIKPGQSDSWSADSLVIPPLPPSGLPGCSIIDINYILKFVVDPSGPSKDLVVPLHVTVGTIPLRAYFDAYSNTAAEAGYAPPAGSANQPGSAPLGGAQLDPAFLYPSATPTPRLMPSAPMVPPGAPPDAPRPTYRTSVYGKVDIKDDTDTQYTMGQTSYATVYPTYSSNNQAYSLPQQTEPSKEKH